MSRPRDNEKPRWVSKLYAIGYVVEMNGNAYTRIAGQRRLCTIPVKIGNRMVMAPLRFTPENKKAAIEILETRIRETINGESAPVVTHLPTVRTLFQAMEEFLQSPRYMNAGKHVQKVYDTAFGYYVTRDMPLDDNEVLHLIERREVECDLATSTRAKYLTRLRQFFDYCINKKWLTANPVRIIGIPSVPRREDALIYTQEEFTAVIDYFVQRPDLKEYELAFRLLWLTAMRSVELLRMSRGDFIFDSESGRVTGLRIHGKKVNGQERMRVFPLSAPGDPDLFPEVRKVVEELLDWHDGQKRQRIFRFQNSSMMQQSWMRAKVEAGIPVGDGRAVHTLRASREWIWENVWMMDPGVFCDLAGHSRSVWEKHYRKRRQQDEIAAAVAHHKHSMTM